MPSQLKRLIPMFIVFIGLFLIVRHFLVPDTFGQYGHYRGDALIDNASKELVHASKEDCFDCHDDIEFETVRNGKTITLHVDPDVFRKSVHGDLECVDCHQDADVEDFPHEESLASLFMHKDGCCRGLLSWAVGLGFESCCLGQWPASWGEAGHRPKPALKSKPTRMHNNNIHMAS